MKKIITGILAALLVSCTAEQQDPDPTPQPEPRPEALELTSFILRAEDNPELGRDWECGIEGNTISLFCPELSSAIRIVPTFSGSFSKVYADGHEQISGRTAVDFRDVVYYHIESEKGDVRTYEVYLKVANGLPQMYIDTRNEPITSKDDYVYCEVQMNNIPESGSFHTTGKIRLRGNATSGYPKRPYKIKFNEKIAPFGMSENKAWALLAEYSDKSLLRNPWMFEVSKAVKAKYTPDYRHVEVYLNGEYEGVYVMTDHIEKAKTRINIKKDGFIVQNNNAISDEPFYFRTKIKKYTYTFKYPDPDDGEIVEGDENYVFIENSFNHLEEVFFSDSIADPQTGYKTLIDPVSWAKWYLIFETTLNYEPNIYFVKEERDSKWEMYPAWDGEWSLALAYRPAATGGWMRYPDGKPVPDDIFWSRGKYFEPLFKDADFVEQVKAEWEELKKQVPAIKQTMRGVCENLKYAQQDNFERWPILSKDVHIGVGLVAFDTWEEEVEYTFSVFDKRIEVIDSFLASF